MKKILTRYVSYLLYYWVARWLPLSETKIVGKYCRNIRAFLCSFLFHKVGVNINVEHNARFHSGALIEIGNNSGIGVNCKVPSNVTIGNNVMMGPDVVILSRNHEFTDINSPMIKQGYSELKRVIIENNVWIGTRVIIMPGITVGSGSIVGAGAVVTKDVPSNAIVGGNPAKVIKLRTSL